MHGAGVRRPLEVRIDEKTYRRPDGEAVVALRDLAFSVAPGETVALIGPSGCGKTTTLRILLGLDRDFVGEVRPAPGSFEIGMAFQEPRLLPWRTVAANLHIALTPAVRPLPVDDVLAAFGLAEWRDRYPGELSLGMARRVALARAFGVDPDLLVLDESFVSLDERTAAELRALVLAAARRRGASVLMVTHNLREALECADRLVLLTPRPARVLATIPLDTPAEERGEEWIERRRNEVAARLAEPG